LKVYKLFHTFFFCWSTELRIFFCIFSDRNRRRNNFQKRHNCVVI